MEPLSDHLRQADSMNNRSNSDLNSKRTNETLPDDIELDLKTKWKPRKLRPRKWKVPKRKKRTESEIRREHENEIGELLLLKLDDLDA